MGRKKIIVLFLLSLFIICGSVTVFARPETFTGKDKIAFISKRDGNNDIYVINDNGTNLIRLTDSENGDVKFAWSHDGSKLLYLSRPWGFFEVKSKLWVVNVDGTGKVMLADDVAYAYEPQWSVDDEKIVYVTAEKKKSIYLVNADGSGKIQLTDSNTEGYDPVWSPDGNKILCYIKEKGITRIYLMDPDGTKKVAINKNSHGTYTEPKWSPDGSKISFVYQRSFLQFGKKSGIYVINVDGSGERFIFEGFNVSWCPDGESMAFIGLKKVNIGNDRSKKYTYFYTTYIADVSGKTKPKKLIVNTNQQIPISWSPDGQKLAYVDAFAVYVHESGESEVRKFIVPYASFTAQWSADSKKLVVVGHTALISKPCLYVVDFVDGEVYLLTENTWDIDPIWGPLDS